MPACDFCFKTPGIIDETNQMVRFIIILFQAYNKTGEIVERDPLYCRLTFVVVQEKFLCNLEDSSHLSYKTSISDPK